jgi:hypothetical protein
VTEGLRRLKLAGLLREETRVAAGA